MYKLKSNGELAVNSYLCWYAMKNSSDVQVSSHYFLENNSNYLLEK